MPYMSSAYSPWMRRSAFSSPLGPNAPISLATGGGYNPGFLERTAQIYDMQRYNPFTSREAERMEAARMGQDRMMGVSAGTAEFAGGVVGARVGTMAGAAIGTALLPGIGTVLGAGVGMVAGTIMGSKTASMMASPFMDQIKQSRRLQDMTKGLALGGQGSLPGGRGMGAEAAQRLDMEIRRLGAEDTLLNKEDYRRLTDLSIKNGLMDYGVQDSQTLKRSLVAIRDRAKLVADAFETLTDTDTMELMGRLQKLGLNTQTPMGSATAALAGGFSRLAGLSSNEFIARAESVGNQFLQRGLAPTTAPLSTAYSAAQLRTGQSLGLVTPEQMSSVGGMDNMSQLMATLPAMMMSSPAMQQMVLGLSMQAKDKSMVLDPFKLKQFKEGKLSVFDLTRAATAAIQGQSEGGTGNVSDWMKSNQTKTHLLVDDFLKSSSSGGLDYFSRMTQMMSDATSLKDVDPQTMYTRMLTSMGVDPASARRQADILARLDDSKVKAKLANIAALTRMKAGNSVLDEARKQEGGLNAILNLPEAAYYKIDRGISASGGSGSSIKQQRKEVAASLGLKVGHWWNFRDKRGQLLDRGKYTTSGSSPIDTFNLSFYDQAGLTPEPGTIGGEVGSRGPEGMFLSALSDAQDLGSAQLSEAETKAATFRKKIYSDSTKFVGGSRGAAQKLAYAMVGTRLGNRNTFGPKELYQEIALTESRVMIDIRESYRNLGLDEAFIFGFADKVAREDEGVGKYSELNEEQKRRVDQKLNRAYTAEMTKISKNKVSKRRSDLGISTDIPTIQQEGKERLAVTMNKYINEGTQKTKGAFTTAQGVAKQIVGQMGQYSKSSYKTLNKKITSLEKGFFGKTGWLWMAKSKKTSNAPASLLTLAALYKMVTVGDSDGKLLSGEQLDAVRKLIDKKTQTGDVTESSYGAIIETLVGEGFIETQVEKDIDNLVQQFTKRLQFDGSPEDLANALADIGAKAAELDMVYNKAAKRGTVEAIGQAVGLDVTSGSYKGFAKNLFGKTKKLRSEGYNSLADFVSDIHKGGGVLDSGKETEAFIQELSVASVTGKRYGEVQGSSDIVMNSEVAKKYALATDEFGRGVASFISTAGHLEKVFTGTDSTASDGRGRSAVAPSLGEPQKTP